MAGNPNEPLDLDAGSTKPVAEEQPRSLEKEPYNQAKATDTARKYIAYWLLAILTGVVALTMVTMAILIYFDATDKDRFDHLVGVLNIIFGPVVTLVSSATGFYYGSHVASAQADAGRGGGSH